MLRFLTSNSLSRGLALTLLGLFGAPTLFVPLMAQSSSALRWRMIGPFRGGRTRAATGVAGQPNVFYVGQVNGGVWKSEDYGRTWKPIFDAQGTQSVGAIAVAPSNNKILYVASGEGLRRPDLSVGDGIYQSSDGGKTWQHLGLRDGQQIPALAVDPRDPKRLFAAVLGHPYGPNEERGIFRSLDGGATWKKVLYQDANTGGSDVVIDPADPNVVYASMWESRLGPWEDGNEYEGSHGGLFKSTDGGETWRQLSKGLPDKLVQINVAIAPSNPKRLYATLSTGQPGKYGTDAGLGVYRSDDSGESWSKATDDPRPALKIGGGDLPVPAVDSKDPDVVYVASIVTLRSMDGGKTWSSLRGAPGGDDYQNLWINPDNPNIILLVSDQGALVSVNRGESWSSWYNQPTAQLYHVAVTHEFPYKVCAGQQESGSVCISSRGNDGSITFREWHPAGVIEYGYAAPDPLHPEIVYGAGRKEVSKYNSLTGQVQMITPIPGLSEGYRGDRTEPILFSPVDPHLLFYATNFLFRTRDYGRSWEKISPDLSREHSGQPASLPALPANATEKRRGAIYSVAASFQKVGTLWAGTDDGKLWITHDQGKNWKDITPPALTPWSKVTQISASHFDDNTAYVSVSRFRIDDLHPYLYRTSDAGATWQPIAAGLPENGPVNTVREDPVRKGLLFAGTENEVWMSPDAGDHWQSLQLNLPHTSMRDLLVNGNDLILATHGRSFWILDDISMLRQLAAVKTGADAILFQPGDAYRVRRSTYTDTPLPPGEPAGENPPDGAVIDYYLPPSVTGVVTLEVLDAKGQLVRKYASSDAPYATEQQLASQLIPLYWLQPPAVLPSTPGTHRWVWDLHEATPLATNYSYPISAVPHATPRTPQGPLALPGGYQVRLTVDGKTFSAPLVIKIDPRVGATAADLAREHSLESQLATSVSSGAEAELAMHSLRDQIAKISNAGVKAPAEGLDKQLAQLLSPEEKHEEPGLDDLTEAVEALYGQVSQADAAPTAAQQQAADDLGKKISVAVGNWQRLKMTGLVDLNQQLEGAHLPALDPQQKPESMPQGGDVD